jgi:hypothetical protein
MDTKEALTILLAKLANDGWYPVDDTVCADSLLDEDARWVDLMYGQNRARILIIPGLELEEVLADYSCKLESTVDKWYDHLEEASKATAAPRAT